MSGQRTVPADTQFLYIAGPYRGAKGNHDHTAYFDIDENIRVAKFWSAECAKAGIPYFCPHLNSAHMEIIVPEVPPKYWLEMDLKILRCASALFLLPNWRSSRGTLAERDEANRLEIPIYHANSFSLHTIKLNFSTTFVTEEEVEEALAVP